MCIRDSDRDGHAGSGHVTEVGMLRAVTIAQRHGIMELAAGGTTRTMGRAAPPRLTDGGGYRSALRGRCMLGRVKLS
eukprot:1792625-Prymnesium_polylepis.1